MPDPATAYLNFHAALQRYLERRLEAPEEVEDVLQDVFLRVTRNQKALMATKEPLAWLYTVARSALIDHIRRQQKRQAIESGEDPDTIPEDLPDTTSQEFSQCIQPLLENLSEAHRDAIDFVDIQGGKQTDLAAARGMKLSTVKSRVQRGRQQLKSAILEYCQVERDVLNNITALMPRTRGEKCCQD